MQPLQTLADVRRDKAARQLVDAQRQHADREARLEELRRYREDYERQSAAATPALMRNRHAFLDRLREAERFQQQLVEQAVRVIDECRAQWLLQQRGCRTVAQLTACYLERERREEDRREQRQLDEFAMQRYQLRSVD
ncbi:flagellar export protein FliJ [Solimonas marina]|uniref:Flagellar FliJ protein n=1 Tax=Solimonas marina TaxID=2714601 RepID=A0A969W8W7_9GAMM|nr:flagellar export protein FliJ [Solimonas marina]NKF21694.1 flagellar export protein FliJ [Solimonas marina]